MRFGNLRKTAFLSTLLLLSSQTSAQDANGVYRYWGDGNTDNNVSKEVFLEACNQVSSLDTFLYSQGASFISDNSQNLIEASGTGVVSEQEVFVSKTDKCMLTYKVAGTYKGTSVNSTIYCPIFQISPIAGGKLKASGLSFMNCFKG